MGWNCRVAWLPAIDDFPSFLFQLGTMPTQERRPCWQARSLSSGSRSATRFCCELFKRHCSWPDIGMGIGTMVRAHRLSTSMGYIAAIFHNPNEYPRVEPPSFGCVVSGAYRPFARSCLSRPRLLPAISPSSSGGQCISRPHLTAIFITLRTPRPRIFGHRANAAPEAEQHSRDSMT